MQSAIKKYQNNKYIRWLITLTLSFLIVCFGLFLFSCQLIIKSFDPLEIFLLSLPSMIIYFIFFAFNNISSIGVALGFFLLLALISYGKCQSFYFGGGAHFYIAAFIYSIPSSIIGGMIALFLERKFKS